MRGSKYNDDIKERARAMLIVDNNVSRVARKLGIPAETVQTWKKKFLEEDELFTELQEQKKREFVEDAWDIIKLATNQVRDKISEAGARDAAIIAGTYYDKQALARGEATQNLTGALRVEFVPADRDTE